MQLSTHINSASIITMVKNNPLPSAFPQAQLIQSEMNSIKQYIFFSKKYVF